MFLDVLSKEDKLNFVELAYLIVKCDEEFADEEREVINNYLIETGIKEIPNTEKSLDELMEYFSNRDENIRKIILFEGYGLVLADDKISEQEKEIVDKLTRMANLEEEKSRKIKKLVIDLKKIYDDIYDTIL